MTATSSRQTINLECSLRSCLEKHFCSCKIIDTIPVTQDRYWLCSIVQDCRFPRAGFKRSDVDLPDGDFQADPGFQNLKALVEDVRSRQLRADICNLFAIDLEHLRSHSFAVKAPEV